MSVMDQIPAELGRNIARQVAPRASQSDQDRCLLPIDLEILRQHNYHLLSIPRQHGGIGASLQECVAAQIELAQGNASLAMVAAMQLQIFGFQSEVRNWPEEIFSRLTSLSVDKGALFNSAASEPELGSPSRGGIFHTRAERVPEKDQLRINGRKTWVTGGKHLTYLLVRLDLDGEPSVVIVPNHLEGLSWEPTWHDSLSLRASESDDVLFKDVLVPRDNHIIPTEKDEPPNLWFPMMLASVYLGVAVGARNQIIKFALERIPSALGKPIAALPSIQRQIGELDIPLQAAQSLLLNVAAKWNPDEFSQRDYYPQVAGAKQFAVTIANQTTESALKIAGGRSLTSQYPFERYFRDVRAGMMQPPSGDAAYELVGQARINNFQRIIANEKGRK